MLQTLLLHLFQEQRLEHLALFRYLKLSDQHIHTQLQQVTLMEHLQHQVLHRLFYLHQYHKHLQLVLLLLVLHQRQLPTRQMLLVGLQ